MFHETDRSDEVLGNEVEYTCKAGILAVGQACDMLQESSIALASQERGPSIQHPRFFALVPSV